MNAIAQDNEKVAPPALENYTDMPVGEILRRTRVHYAQTLDDVSGYLRIRASWLDALEKGDIDQLPGRAYAIGYVRTYSEYLGLDGEKMIQLIKMQSGGRTSKPDLRFPVSASESKVPNIGVIIGSLAVLALVIGVWMALSNTGKKADVNLTEVPNVPADIKVTETVTATPAPAEVTTSVQVPVTESQNVEVPGDVTDKVIAAARQAAETAAAQKETPVAADVEDEAPAEPSVPKREIIINVVEKSWVEVRDQKGKPILSRILKPGEVFSVPEENYGLSLDTGNAAGIELSVNGQKLPPLGQRGDILRGLSLDGEKLLQRYPVKATGRTGQ